MKENKIHPMIGKDVIWSCRGTMKKEGEGKIIDVDNQFGGYLVEDSEGFVETVPKCWVIKIKRPYEDIHLNT